MFVLIEGQAATALALPFSFFPLKISRHLQCLRRYRKSSGPAPPGSRNVFRVQSDR